MLTALLLCYSTFIFTYAGTPFSHILSALWVLLCYIYLKERKQYLVAGLFAGLAFLTEYPTGLLLILWPILLYYNTKKVAPLIQFYGGVLPVVVVQLGYNYVFTGSAFDMLYNHPALDLYHNPNTIFGFAVPIPEAMWKLLFGFYRGLFFHAPVLILIVAIQLKELIQFKASSRSIYVLLFLIVSYLFFSSHIVWYGGWCFGPRHFVPVTVLLLYCFAREIDFKGSKGWLSGLLFAAGIGYVWLDKCTVQYSVNAELKNSLIDAILPEFRIGNFNSNNVLTICWNATPEDAAYIWLIIFCSINILLICKVIFDTKKTQHIEQRK